jgi:hypothetical protein
VTLVHEGRTLVVAIKGGRGETTAKALAAFLPRLDRSAPHALIIHQQIGQRLFPIVVNMPHVPEAGEAGNQASLDALLDDFRGRVPLPKGGDDEGDDEGGEDDVPTDDDDEIEARLDEVRHQGELDQLAVKAALLYRLVRAAAKAGDERDGQMAELATAAVAACNQHLRAAMRTTAAATMGMHEPRDLQDRETTPGMRPSGRSNVSRTARAERSRAPMTRTVCSLPTASASGIPGMPSEPPR